MSKRQNDPEDYIIYRGEAVFSSLNKFPYNVGHVMIIPSRHVESFEELEDQESMETLKVLKVCIAAVRAVLKPDGFNIGVNIGPSAGAGVQHFHLHLVPRWIGDTNFMPILSDTKVLSQSLDRISSALSEEIRKQVS